jgi:hypothetical protein
MSLRCAKQGKFPLLRLKFPKVGGGSTEFLAFKCAETRSKHFRRKAYINDTTCPLPVAPSHLHRCAHWGRVAMSGRNRSWFQQRFNGFLTALIPQGSKAKSTTAQSRASMESVLFPSPQSTLKRPWTPPEPLPKYSTPPVPNSAWCSQSFMMGAGMVILQPSTDRVVVVHDSVDGHWFLPRGRKDIGESLEKTALREAYEEVCQCCLFSLRPTFDIMIISMYSRAMRLSFCHCISHRVPLLLRAIQKHFSA